MKIKQGWLGLKNAKWGTPTVMSSIIERIKRLASGSSANQRRPDSLAEPFCWKIVEKIIERFFLRCQQKARTDNSTVERWAIKMSNERVEESKLHLQTLILSMLRRKLGNEIMVLKKRKRTKKKRTHFRKKRP